MKKLLKISIFLVIFCVLAVAVAATFFISNVMSTYNSVEFNKEKLIATTQQISLYDSNENDITQNANVVKTVVKLEELPSYIPNSFLSIEDKRFYNHNGLDCKRIAKAMFNNLKSGTFKEGASTISQQLIKNTHLSNEKTWERKFNEMILTKKLEKTFNKKDILETYLNVIYFGEGSYGLEAASQTYFSKPAKELSIGEGALLAAIIKSPAKYSPVYQPENAVNRRNLVLKLMLNEGKITTSQFEEEQNKPIQLTLQNFTLNANHLYAKAAMLEAANLLQLSEKDVASSGLKIYTHLNSEKQNTLSNILSDESNYHTNSFGNTNDSLAIIMNNETYGVEAFFGKSPFNLTHFVRQPGSVIKPILVYAPALELGQISPVTQILDEPIDFNGYSPNNVGNTFHGYVSVTESISKSLNIPAIKTLNYVGIEQAKQFATNAGIAFDATDNGYAIALGGFTYGNTLKDITNSYLPFANNGNYDKAHFVKKIVNSSGKVLFEQETNKKQIMGSDTAFLMTSMLKDGVKNGTSKKLSSLPFEVAGKTGTVCLPNSNLNSDAYSIAYTTKHTMGVWFGNYSNDPEFVLEGSNNGGTYATNVIKLAFQSMYENDHPQPFATPDTVTELKIDSKTLEDEHIVVLADESCPERYTQTAWFSKRYAPTQTTELFHHLNVENFDVVYHNNVVTISFLAKDYYTYEIKKRMGNKVTSVRTVDNFEGIYECNDTNLEPNTKYEYFVAVTNPYNKETNESDAVIILTNKAEESLNHLLQNLVNKPKPNTNAAWYFQ